MPYRSRMNCASAERAAALSSASKARSVSPASLKRTAPHEESKMSASILIRRNCLSSGVESASAETATPPKEHLKTQSGLRKAR